MHLIIRALATVPALCRSG